MRFSVELRLPQHLQARLRLEVVQRSKAGDDRSKRGGNRWIGCVGQMRLAVHQIAVNLSLEGFAHLARGSGELNRHTPGMDLVDGESVRLQPGGYGRHVRVGRSVKAAKFRRGEPLMKR